MLDDVNFDLRIGERLGVVGGPHSGKSALARALLWAAEPPQELTSGTLELSGRPLHSLGEQRWQDVQCRRVALLDDYVRGVDPGWSIGRQITSAVSRRGGTTEASARHSAVELLDEVGMPNPARVYGYLVNELTAELQIRAMLALALAREPAVLVVDEPLAHRDPLMRRQILGALQQVSDSRGMAVVVTGRDLDVLACHCDTLQVLLAGRTVERGPAKQVATRPRHRYTEALRLGHGFTENNDRSHAAFGCAFEPECAVGRGHAECRQVTPGPTAFSSQYGSVTAKCHHPTGKAPARNVSGRRRAQRPPG
ncbi:ATP-binding cassette domain-containing protein [Rhodococcus sp. JS3073]|uniref:ATP-binding cassette domain-containing protein n=1 Tax=Rhodococcus sp. JS3073 TaxID=3002901 RepID=UPI002286B5BF|nr:ATP-binding cassette domain-containing protein [Rhodococcus sp. JS3073]WAM18971.1 ATP-binding cassette domain-containing protein [Rhodococcus sp. JS3073]